MPSFTASLNTLAIGENMQQLWLHGLLHSPVSQSPSFYVLEHLDHFMVSTVSQSQQSECKLIKATKVISAFNVIIVVLYHAVMSSNCTYLLDIPKQ